MLESLTIFTPGGLILYQYCATPSLLQATDGAAFTRQTLNGNLIQKVLLDPANTKSYHIDNGVTFVWHKEEAYYICAMYPDILFEGPRQYLKTWAEGLLAQTAKEFELYMISQNDSAPVRPNPAPFDRTFRVLLNTSKTQKQQAAPSTKPSSSSKAEAAATNLQPSSKTKGKEMRNWHDGTAKVTDKAMSKLDMSKELAGSAEEGHARALQEAREAYLPSSQELEQEGDVDREILNSADDDDHSDSSSWTGALTGLFQQITGNKVLTSADLDQPLERMGDMLKEKNVAGSIAHELCEAVRQQLVGKRLNSMHRVQTAVRQALEATLTRLLQRNPVDLLRNVLQNKQRGSGGSLSFLSSSKKQRPYVITVMGINGIGKTTSLAKLAYYFQQHGCKPLLVAGDTFRSGAVEQLQVHADCLAVPLFSQGYSKDPSAVTKAAIECATENGNDVVLVDTAGRMQNNVPLMKALGKLVTENQPDFCILVCEALVGHDGLSQFKMFQQALGPRRLIDGLILTKFDTVDKKVGASLTLTSECSCPIVFIGVGQKYHHLKKLNVSTVIKSLFS